MKQWKIQIKGTSPVLWNVRKKELFEEQKALKKNEYQEWEEKNWPRKAEYDENGRVIIPTRWLMRALIVACKKTRLVPHFETTKKATYTSYVQIFMIYNADNGVCNVDELEKHEDSVDAQGGNGGGKSIVWRCWPMKREWTASFRLVDPAGRMLKSELKELLEYIGLFIGLGDQRNRGFGRFELINLEEIKDERK